MNERIAIFGRVLLLTAVLAAPHPVEAQIAVGSTSQVSLSTTGGAPAGSSGSPAAASNGKIIAFNSSAENLVSGDSNKSTDVFIRDLQSGAITRASINSAGVQTSGDSTSPAVSQVSPEGLFVVTFVSFGRGLGSIEVTNESQQVYIRVPKLGVTEIVSFAPGALEADGSSFSPSVTLVPGINRVLVAYASDATNLVNDDLNKETDVFLASADLPVAGGFSDLASSVTTIKLSNGTSRAGADASSNAPKVSGDGRFVVFASQASNLIAGQTLANIQIYRYTVASGELSLISKDSTGTPANDDCGAPSISYSGRFVSYVSRASNLVSGGTAGKAGIIMHDLVKNTITRVNSDSNGVASDGDATSPAVSGNGRFIAFSDNGTNLVSGDQNGISDVFLKDLDTNTTVRLSDSNGVDSNSSSDSSIVTGDSFNSLSGSIFFRSFATNLTDSNSASGAGDIFAREATLAAPQLKKGSLIETPADILIKGKRSVITAQKFSFPTSASAPLIAGAPDMLAARSGKKTVTYDYKIQGTGKRKQVRLNLTGKRNSVTTAKLKPGNYNASYRVVAREGTKVVSRTPFSPRQQFQIK